MMGYNAAMHILMEAEDLKLKVMKSCDLLIDTEIWTNQQKLQNIYHKVLVLDLEYALDKKVEQDLWNVVFKNHITNLQEKARDKKNPRRSDFQALLTWALESASGFYLTLLHELCDAFDLNLPFRSRGMYYGQMPLINNKQIGTPQMASCSYICQYCLVHLGDIARYRNQRKEAESFYKKAVLVSPTSGHPYNQLALLETSRGDKLSTIFYYIRGICVKNPFPAATTNLISVLNSTIGKESPLDKIQTKMSVAEYIQLFLCTHGYFHTLTDLTQAQMAVKSLNTVMTALVATQSFNEQELIKITIINLYALNHLGSEEELTGEKLTTRNLILELIAGSLSSFLMPVYTLKSNENLLNYYALPAMKFLMYFIYNTPEILKCDVFKELLQIWPSLCKLVNRSQNLLKGFDYEKYSRFPLPEDKNLQGFLPLDRNLKVFDSKEEIDTSRLESMIRMKRIVDFALWLSDYDLNGTKLISKTENNGIYNFEPLLTQPDPTNELLEEMKSISIQEPKSDKKTGILKPQGSLEKAREEREIKKSAEEVVMDNPKKNADVIKNKRSKQNVALLSIIKKMEESKQVKFNVDNAEKEKTPKSEPPIAQSKMSPQFPQPQMQPIQHSGNAQQPLRNHNNYNQPHLAFQQQQQPTKLNQPYNQANPDYLANLRNLGNSGDNSMIPPFSTGRKQPNQDAGNVPNFPPPYGNVPPNFDNWGRKEVNPHPSANNQHSWWGQNLPFQGFYPAQNQSNNYHMPRPLQNMHSFPGQLRPQNYPPPPMHENSSNFGGMGFPPPPPSPYKNVPPIPYPPHQQQNNILPNNAPPHNQGYPFEMFNSPSWTSHPSNGPMNGNNKFVGGRDDGRQPPSISSASSMRQTMLNEGAPSPSSQQTATGGPKSQDASQIPGYSLFSNSWSPNIQSQFLSNNNNNQTQVPPAIPDKNDSFNGPQHSLFGGHGPQSLAQLLEHQQHQKIGGDVNK